MPQSFLTGIRPYLALVLLCLTLYLPGQSAVPPMDRDEARFVQATRQMLETGDYVHIFFQDTPRNKKPAGIYWLQAVSVAAFSTPESTAIWPYRLPSLLGALAAVLMTFAFGARLFGRQAALIGAGLLGGSLMLTTEAHLAKTDAVLLACVVAAQGALGLFYMAGKGAPKPGFGPTLVFWLAQGIGILIKGPIVPLVSLLTYLCLSLADRDWRWMKASKPLLGLVLVAAIVSPWFNAMRGSGFVEEAVSRDLIPKLMGGQERHGGWPGYYLLASALTLWPGSLFLWPALVRAWGRRTDFAVRFCLAWAAPTWLIFELIPTKLPHYTLPTYPALTLLIGSALVAFVGGAIESPLRHWGAKAFAAFWMVLGLALAGAMVWLPFKYGGGFTPWSLPAALGAFGATFLGGAWFLKERYAQALAAGLAGAVMLFVAVFAGLFPGLDDFWLSRRAGEALERLVPNHGPVVVAEYHEPSLVFQLGTETLLTGGAEAASFLLGNPGAVAIIGGREEEAFQAGLNRSGGTVTLIETIEGFNYSRGRETVLRLYVTP